MKTSVEATETAGATLQVSLLLNPGQPLPVHPELDIKTFSFVLPVLDGAGDSEEPVTTGLLHQTGLLVGGDVVLVFQCHVDTVASDGI